MKTNRKSALIIPLVVAMLLLSGCAGNGAASSKAEPITQNKGKTIQSKTIQSRGKEAMRDNAAKTSEHQGSTDEKPQEEGEAADEETEEEEEHAFTIIARKWEFDPSEIRVKQGEHVELYVTSEDVEHGISIPAFDVNERLPPGKTVDISFVADKRGTFPMACSVYCGAGHSSMKGQIIVE